MLATRRQIRDLEAQLQGEATQQPTTSNQPARVIASAGEISRAESTARCPQRDDYALQPVGSQGRAGQATARVLASYQAKVDAAPARESELVELTRDYTTLQQTYQSLLARRQDSKIAANLERRWASSSRCSILPCPRTAVQPESLAHEWHGRRRGPGDRPRARVRAGVSGTARSKRRLSSCALSTCRCWR